MNLNGDKLIIEIDATLPQTQCRQCGYAGCKPYATAIANGSADINQCPPGGDAGVHALADLLKVNYQPLNPSHGVHKPKALAFIDEAACIGCTLCIQACPVDAILGASKQMHTIIASECTGCELCIAPCPVDCIQLLPSPASKVETKQAADIARQRYEAKLMRIEQQQLERSAKDMQRQKITEKSAIAVRQAAIAAALARAKSQALTQGKNDER